MKPASAVETTKPKLVVLEVTPGGGIDPTIAAALGDAITLEIAKRGYFTPTSMKELQTMLGVERQKQLMGCSEAASQCMAELADAIGARFVLNGSLTRLGDAFQLALQVIDTTKAQPIGRSVREPWQL
jgi:TolB-like protein